MSNSMRVLQRRRRQRQRRQQRQRHKRWLGGTATAVFLLAIFSTMTAIVLGAAAVFLTFYRPLPDIAVLAQLSTASQQPIEPTQIFASDENGRSILLYEVSAVDSEWLSLEEIPAGLLDAMLAAEDPRYWEDPAASPILQQLIHQHLLRKAPANANRWQQWQNEQQRAILTRQLSQQYTSEQLLETYLNTRYYGHLSFGVAAAAQTYFGKTAVSLTLPEATTLAAIPASSQFDAFTEPDQITERQTGIIDTLVATQRLDFETAQLVKGFDVVFVRQPEPRFDIIAPHFALYVRQTLEQRFGAEKVLRGGLRVTTTLDPDLQQQAECTIRIQLAQLQQTAVPPDLAAGCAAAQQLQPPRATATSKQVNTAALLALDPRSGHIRAMVGSSDYWNRDIDGATNLATAPTLQPGSALHPFVYLTMLSQGYNAATMLFDVEQNFGFFVPPNWSVHENGRFHGPVRLRTALANGYHPPALQALSWVGPNRLIRTARNLGIISLASEPNNLSLPLQGGQVSLIDMVYGHSVIANRGVVAGQPRQQDDQRPFDPVAILRVEESDGTLLYEQQQNEREILSNDLAYLLNDLLSDRNARCLAFGCPNALELSNNRPAAVAAGHTATYEDAWTVGATPQLAVGVWVGNHDRRPTAVLSGGEGAAPVWHAVMNWAMADEPVEQWQRPATLREMLVCEISGLLPTAVCPTISEIFIPGTEPIAVDSIYREVALNRENGRLATIYTPSELIERQTFQIFPDEVAAWALANNIPQPPTEFDTIANVAAHDQYQLLSPKPFAIENGRVPLIGTIQAGRFTSYRLAYFPGLTPDALTIIADGLTDPKDNELLTMWDTSELDNGLYTILLTVFEGDGRFVEIGRHVTLNN